MKEFACKDAGMKCDWKTEGKSTDDLLKNIGDHAREKHGISKLTAELKSKVMSQIHEKKSA